MVYGTRSMVATKQLPCSTGLANKRESNDGNAVSYGNTTAQAVQYKSYPDEPLNPRIANPVLQGNCLLATIDRVPYTIQLPEHVVGAYQAGALPLNTLAYAVLAKSDQMRQMIGLILHCLCCCIAV